MRLLANKAAWRFRKYFKVALENCLVAFSNLNSTLLSERPMLHVCYFHKIKAKVEKFHQLHSWHRAVPKGLVKSHRILTLSETTHQKFSEVFRSSFLVWSILPSYWYRKNLHLKEISRKGILKRQVDIRLYSSQPRKFQLKLKSSCVFPMLNYRT